MNALRFWVLSFTVCALLSTARGQDSRAQAWIHQVFDLHQHRYTQQDLFVAGYRADQARDYDTAFDKLSRFGKANHDRLHAATSPDEKAFRSWLESRLNDLEEVRKQGTPRDGADEVGRSSVHDNTTRVPSLGSQSGGSSQGPSISTSGNSNSELKSHHISIEFDPGSKGHATTNQPSPKGLATTNHRLIYQGRIAPSRTYRTFGPTLRSQR